MTEIFKSKPAPIDPVSALEKEASADIRKTIERGSSANFAGHYRVIEGPNAPDYAQVVIVDLVTGRIFQPPFAGKGGPSASYFSIPSDPFDFNSMEFRLDSSLVVLPRACPDRARGCSTYYFLWKNDTWIPVDR